MNKSFHSPSVDFLEGRSPQECWVWDRICDGEIADFNQKKDDGGNLWAKKSEGWTEVRILSSSFIETLLINKKAQSYFSRHGVRVVGAWIKDSLELDYLVINFPFLFFNCRFENAVNFEKLTTSCHFTLAHSFFGDFLSLAHSKVENYLDLRAVKVTQSLKLNDFHVNGSFYLGEGAEFRDVSLRGSRVKGFLHLQEAKVSGVFAMDCLQVQGDLDMSNKSEFSEIILNGATVGGHLNLNGAKVTGALEMNGLRVERSLHMHEGAQFADIDLTTATIGSQLILSGSNVTGTLKMNSLVVSDLFMGGELNF